MCHLNLKSALFLSDLNLKSALLQTMLISFTGIIDWI